MPSTTDTFFQALGLPPRLSIDVDATRDHFLELSRRYHPDFYATADAAERAESLKLSSLVNNAWKTFRDPHKRAEYAVFVYGNNIESNKNAVPPELLEEMFEIQEAGEELREARLGADEAALARAEARIAPLRAQVVATRDQMEARLEELFRQFDAAADADPSLDGEACQAALREIRLVLDRMNYLRTVLRNLK